MPFKALFKWGLRAGRGFAGIFVIDLQDALHRADLGSCARLPVFQPFLTCACRRPFFIWPIWLLPRSSGVFRLLQYLVSHYRHDKMPLLSAMRDGAGVQKLQRGVCENAVTPNEWIITYCLCDLQKIFANLTLACFNTQPHVIGLNKE